MKHYSSLASPFNGHAIRSRRSATFGLKGQCLFRAEVRQILGDDTTMPCPRCAGTGLVGPFWWDMCPHCRGLGITYAISLDELDRRRQAVLALHPDAGLQGWQPGLTPRW